MQVSSTKNKFVDNTSFVHLHDDGWIKRQRIAGRVAAGALSLLEGLVRDKTEKSLIELNAIAEEYIESHDCSCTFKNYRSFPAGACISVGHNLVHGIPTNYHLQEGDLISFDLGATYEGAIGDTAITLIYGQPKHESHVKLINATKDALYKAIASIKIGKRLGAIGETISKVGRENRLSVVSTFGGHGISEQTAHAQPFVSNKDVSNNGVRFVAGMTLAIEPLFVIGNSAETKKLSDGWTIEAKNMSAHFEHSTYIHEDGSVEIMTLREGETL